MTSSGMAGLGDPVVDPEPQAAHPLGDGRASGADDHAEVGKHPADALDVPPAFLAEHGRVEQDRVELHRDQLLGRDRAAEHALLPAGGLGALGEHRDEATVVVDYREPDGLLCVQDEPRVYAPPERRSARQNPAFTGFSQVGIANCGQAPEPARLSGSLPRRQAPRARLPPSRDSSLVRERPTCPGPFAISGRQLIAPAAVRTGPGCPGRCGRRRRSRSEWVPR